MISMNQDWRFLLLGLPQMHAVAIGQALRATGAAVDLGCCGPRGRLCVRSQAYDVILIAPRMRPAADLAEVAFCRRHNSEAGILAMVPGRDTRQVAQVLNHGADDCMAMPVDTDELLARLHALARRVSRLRPAATVIRIHDLEIDTVSRTVRRGGRVIPLTAREYGLLRLLALHPGRVVSRSEIREHLYRGQDECGSNVIDVYIRYLRTKLDEGFALSLILTRWGQGYLLRTDAELSLSSRAS